MNTEKEHHVPMTEYFSGDWRSHLQSEETVKNILDVTGISETNDLIKVRSRYWVDDDRLALILLLQKKGTKVLDKAIIDIISGQPTFDQFVDVGYNIGADCKYRIIVYDGNEMLDINSPVDGRHIIAELMSSLAEDLFASVREYEKSTHVKSPVLQIFPECRCANIYLLTVDCCKGENQDTVKFQVFTDIREKAGEDYTDLPDRKLVYKQALWGPYMQMRHGESPCFRCHFATVENSLTDDWGFAEMEAKWVDKEMVVHITIYYRHWKWPKNQEDGEIQKEFDGCDMIYSEDGYELMISKKIPFQNFMYATPECRESLVEEFLELTGVAENRLEPILDENMKSNFR